MIFSPDSALENSDDISSNAIHNSHFITHISIIIILISVALSLRNWIWLLVAHCQPNPPKLQVPNYERVVGPS